MCPWGTSTLRNSPLKNQQHGCFFETGMVLVGTLSSHSFTRCVSAQIMVQPFGGMNKRGYKCVGLTDESSDDATFMNNQEGREMSVTEYFLGRYQKRCLQHTLASHQHALWGSRPVCEPQIVFCSCAHAACQGQSHLSPSCSSVSSEFELFGIHLIINIGYCDGTSRQCRLM